MYIKYKRKKFFEKSWIKEVLVYQEGVETKLFKTCGPPTIATDETCSTPCKIYCFQIRVAVGVTKKNRPCRC